jgi:hypothetical protein
MIAVFSGMVAEREPSAIRVGRLLAAVPFWLRLHPSSFASALPLVFSQRQFRHEREWQLQYALDAKVF